MNLQKLFETQKVLRERFEKEHPIQEGENRFEKKVLALLVEIGECANEQRSWKYWSNDQVPRIWANTCVYCLYGGMKSCCGCEGKKYKNKVLEEYVDGFHLVLELGIELGLSENLLLANIQEGWKVEELFIEIYALVVKLNTSKGFGAGKAVLKINYEDLMDHYIGLGEKLGFTWEQIEQAYFEKNKINHQRQEAGY